MADGVPPYVSVFDHTGASISGNAVRILVQLLGRKVYWNGRYLSV